MERILEKVGTASKITVSLAIACHMSSAQWLGPKIHLFCKYEDYSTSICNFSNKNESDQQLLKLKYI
jgi:hypothetical protein